MKSHAAIEILHQGKSLGHFVVDRSGTVMSGFRDAESAQQAARTLIIGAPGLSVSTFHSSDDEQPLKEANGSQVELRLPGQTDTFPLGTFFFQDSGPASITFDPEAPARIFV